MAGLLVVAEDVTAAEVEVVLFAIVVLLLLAALWLGAATVEEVETCCVALKAGVACEVPAGWLLATSC